MKKIKTVKIKEIDGSIGEESYTITTDAKNVDMDNGKNVQETIGTININEDGNIATQLKNKISKNNIVDNLESSDANKVLSANQGKILGDKINKKPYHFNNIEDMKKANLKAGDTVLTLGYYEANDGGSAIYSIVNDNTLIGDGGLIHNLNNGLKAKMIIKDYVTPEQFGAKGDNETDDTKAFQLAVNSRYTIKCTKNYYFKSSIIDNELKNLKIEGNEKTNFRNFHLIKNIDIENNYKWVHAYMTRLSVSGINFTSNNNVIFSTGSQTIIENCNFSNVNTIIATANGAYIDTIIMKKIVISEYRTISGLSGIYYVGSYDNNGNVISTGLGDMYNFENVHMTAGSSSTSNHGRIFARFYGQASVIFTNCLNIRAKFSQANCIFNACHFEDVSGIKDSWVSNSELTFIGCSFAADSFFVSDARYTGCTCTCHPVNGRFYNSPDVDFEQCDVPEDVDLIVNAESGRLGTPKPINRDGGIGLDTVNGIINDPTNVTSPLAVLNGEYTYTFNYSPVKTIVAGRNATTTKTFTTDGTKIPSFTLNNHYLKYMYGYVTRTDAQNNTVWAMIPPRMVTRYIDYGNHINGSKWNNTTPPERIAENANVYGFKKGIVFSKSKIGYYSLGLLNQYSTSDRESMTII